MQTLLCFFCFTFLCTGTEWFTGKPTGRIGPTAVARAWQPAPDLNEPLAYALDISVAPNGALALLDGKDARVFVWRPDGSFHTVVSREGKGPGELEGPNFVALSDKYLFVFQFNGAVTVFNHEDDYAMTSARRLKVGQGFPRVLMPLDGDALLLGRADRVHQEAPMIAQVIHLNGSVSEQPSLKFTVDYPLWDIANMSDPNEKVRLGMPRLWATRRKGGGFYYGFSNTNKVARLDAYGKVVGERRLQLPRLRPEQEDKDVFMDTPLAVIEKTPNEFPKDFGFTLKLDDENYMSYYSQFVDYGSHFIIFVSPMGGFQMADFLVSGDRCQYYDVKTEKVTHRGRLSLAEDTRLYVTEDRIIRVRFNEDDLMVAEDIVLGWVPQP